MKIAAQAYSVRDEMTADYIGTIKALKEMGYEGIEFPGLYGQSAEDIKKACDDVGIEIVAYTTNKDDFMANAESIAEICKTLNCEYAGLPYLPPESFEEGNMEQTVEDMKNISSRLKAHGIMFMYHNHAHEFRGVNGKYYLDSLFDAFDKDELKAEFDLGWVHVGGEDPVDYVNRYADRHPLLHVKNYAGTSGSMSFEFRPVGYGKVDWMPIVNAMLNTPTDWLIVEQDAPSLGKSPLECMKMSVNYLRPIIPEV